MDHELQPGGRQQIEGGSRDEGLASQQLPAHGARVGRQERALILEHGVLDGHVAAKTRVGTSHQRHAEIVERAVDGASGQVARVGGDRVFHADRWQVPGVVQVGPAQGGADAAEDEGADESGKAMPPDRVVDQLGKSRVGACPG